MLGFIIRNTVDFKNIEAIKYLYYALVRSKLEFGSVIWSPHYEIHINMIEKVQKKFVRYLFFKKFNFYTYLVPYIQSLDIFDICKLSVRRKVASLIYLYKLLKGVIDDSSILSKISFYEPAFNSRSSALFKVPRYRTVHRASSPLYRMMTLFNSVSSELDIFNINSTAFRVKCYQLLN